MTKTIFAVLFLWAGFSSAAEVSVKKIEVQGHRGTRGTRPENTLAAFREALRVGVDVLEMDMGVTKDGVIVVSHDSHIPPELCLGPGGARMKAPAPLRSLTFSETQRYDCGSLKNPRFPGQTPAPGSRIPALDEVFKMVAASGERAARVGFNIETKITPGEPELAPSPEEFARLFVELVRKHGLTDRVVLQSFDWRTLIAAKQLEPKLIVSQLVTGTLVDLAAVAKASKAEIISPEFSWIDKATVDYLHKSGIRVAPWTLNTKAEWDKALDYGVDSIITDYPAELITYLKQKSLR